ncbi:MAG: hypothetical protein ABEJ95_06465 [Candidatus Nanohalobium sp.]
MSTPILKRRLNPLLLISTVAALSLLAGVSVVYQDKLSEAHDIKREINQSLQEKSREVERLEAVVSNRTARLSSLKDNVSRLKKVVEDKSSELERVRDMLGERNSTVKDLRNRLEEERAEPNMSKTVERLNTSLAVVCTRLSPSDDESEWCTRHGHEVNSSEG